MNPSTASRLLATLERGGLVEREPGGPYRLGLHLVALADRVLARLDVRDLARPQLRALVEATGETATLSVPDGEEAVTVDFVPGGIERREHGAPRPAERPPRHGDREGAARPHRPGAGRARPLHRAHARPTRRRWRPSCRPSARRAGPRPSASGSRTSTRSPPRSRDATARSWPSSACRARRGASRPSAAGPCCPSCSPPRRRSRARWAAEPARWAVRPDSRRRTARPRAAADNRRVTVPRRLRLLVLVPCLLLGLPAAVAGAHDGPHLSDPVAQGTRIVDGEPVAYGYHSDAVADVPDATVVAPVARAELAGVPDAALGTADAGLDETWCGDAPPALDPGTGTPDDVAHEVHPPSHAAVQGRLRLRVRPGRAASTSWPTGSRRTCRCSRASWPASPAARRRSASTWARRAAPATSTSRSSACRGPSPPTRGRTSPSSPPTSAPSRGARAGPRDWIVYADAHAPGLGGRHGRVLLRRRRPRRPAATSHDAGRLVSVVWGPASLPASPYADPTTMLHEMGHNLGAVQGGAPHTTGTVGSMVAGHCTDEWDVMCYADGGSDNALTYPCPQRSDTVTETFDCGGDDYFNPAPAAGSWLASHWNVYASAMLGACAGQLAGRLRRRDPGAAAARQPDARRAVRLGAPRRTRSRSPARTRRSGSGASTAERSARARRRPSPAAACTRSRPGSARPAASGRRGARSSSGSTPPRPPCGSTASARCCPTSPARRAAEDAESGVADLVISDGRGGSADLLERADRPDQRAGDGDRDGTDRVGLVGTAQREIALPATTTCRPSRPSPRRRGAAADTHRARPGPRPPRPHPGPRAADGHHRRHGSLGAARGSAASRRPQAPTGSRPASSSRAASRAAGPAPPSCGARAGCPGFAVSAALVRGPVQATGRDRAQARRPLRQAAGLGARVGRLTRRAAGRGHPASWRA